MPRGGWKLSGPHTPAQRAVTDAARRLWTERRNSLTDAERWEEILPRINKTDTCWLWTGGKQSNGYGQVGVRGKVEYVHVLSYRVNVGPIPKGLELDHVAARGCTHKNCCNPAHLEPVTQAENKRRASCGPICKRGHRMEGKELYVTPNGRRQCRVCMRLRDKWRVPRRRPALDREPV